MSRVTNSQRLRYESNAGPKDHQQHRINPLARWEEDWGEGKEAQTKVLRHDIPQAPH